MSDLVRSALSALQRRNAGFSTNPELCATLLLHECPQFPRQVQLLVAALRLGTVRRLRAPFAGEARQRRLERLSRELVQRQGWTADDAAWTVEAWANALDVRPEPVAPLLPLFPGECHARRPVPAEAQSEGAFAGLCAGGAVGAVLALAGWMLADRYDSFDAYRFALLIWPAIGAVLGAGIGLVVGRLVSDNRALVAASLAGLGCGVVGWLVYLLCWHPVLSHAPLSLTGTVLALLTAVVMGIVIGGAVGLPLQYPHAAAANAEADEDQGWQIEV